MVLWECQTETAGLHLGLPALPLPRICRETLGRPGAPRGPRRGAAMLSPVTSAYFTRGLRAEGAGSPPTDLVGPKAIPGRQSARGSGWAALPPEPSLNLLARDAEHCQPSWGSREQEGPADARGGAAGAPARRTSSEDRSSSPSRGPTRG